MRTIIRSAILGIAMFSAGAAVAATPAEKCEAAKKAEAGLFTACRLKAEAKLVIAGDTAKYDAALAKCTSKLTGKFDKLEAGGACPSTGDANTIVDFLTSCSDGVVGSTGGGGALPTCGDASINVAGEECDGAALGGRSCGSLGFSGGSLACTGTCTFDTSACTSGGGGDCGNGAIDAGEDCDQGDLNGGSCSAEGFAGGSLACGAGCTYDTGGCWNTRFIDNGDGTITDNLTRLMWEKKVKKDSVVDLANRQDADNTHVWSGLCSISDRACQPDATSEAACLDGADASTNGCGQCPGGEGVCSYLGAAGSIWQWLVALNTDGFAGHSDWRIPVRQELTSLHDLSRNDPSVDPAFHGAACGAACSDLADPTCSCTRSEFYWPATSYSLEDTAAWPVDFYDGIVPGGHGMDFSENVRAVRSLD